MQIHRGPPGRSGSFVGRPRQTGELDMNRYQAGGAIGRGSKAVPQSWRKAFVNRVRLRHRAADLPQPRTA